MWGIVQELDPMEKVAAIDFGGAGGDVEVGFCGLAVWSSNAAAEQGMEGLDSLLAVQHECFLNSFGALAWFVKCGGIRIAVYCAHELASLVLSFVRQNRSV
jgi:hypothetical protein